MHTPAVASQLVLAYFPEPAHWSALRIPCATAFVATFSQRPMGHTSQPPGANDW